MYCWGCKRLTVQWTHVTHENVEGRIFDVDHYRCSECGIEFTYERNRGLLVADSVNE